MAERERQMNPVRVFVVVALFTVWAASVSVRLVQLQVVRHKELAAKAAKGQMQTRPVIAPRGIIYDAHMDKLAANTSVDTVLAAPHLIRDKAAAARGLALVLGLDSGQLLGRLCDPDRQNYLRVKRRIDPQSAERIEALGLEGIYTESESVRVYPNVDLACHVLGFVNMNDDGSEGIEGQYDRYLKGTPGVLAFDVDAHGKALRGRFIKPSVPGHSLVLSIDRSLQHIAAEALSGMVQARNAAAGTAIIMETATGRILAMANVPQYNGNKYSESGPETRRNRAVTDFFEPGSTFKVVVVAAALEAGLARSGEIIDCQMGSITIGGHVFHDHNPYGLLTLSQVLEKSSNVGATKLGVRLGEQRLHAAIRNFGFGAKTGIDLPAEALGLVRDYRDWSALSIGAISFGQEVGVTSLQILNAVNAIASGGYLVRPTIVDRIIDHMGNTVRARVTERRRILSPETAAAVRDAFEGVVLRGTGKKAALEGYRAGGKTGTAQKIIDGRYSDTKYLASFIGFAPLPQPLLTIVVLIDEPRGGIYGGDVSAPVFARIAQQSLMQLHVPPDRTLPLPKFNPALAAVSSEDFIPNATPVLPLLDTSSTGPAQPSGTGAIVMSVDPHSVIIPDFRGQPKRRVLERCMELGIRMEGRGAGVAVHQLPLPGSRIAAGETCQLTFSSSSAAARALVPGLDASAAPAGSSQAGLSAAARPRGRP